MVQQAGPRFTEETFELNSQDTVAIPTANRADGTALTWSEIWRYQVPTGIGHVLRPEDTLSVYLDDLVANAEAGVGTSQLRLEIRDSAEQDRKVVYGPVLYTVVRSFTDRDLIARLNLAKAFALTERMWIVLLTRTTNGTDESDSYFTLSMSRVRRGLS